jgi:hypothetical protein
MADTERRDDEDQQQENDRLAEQEPERVVATEESEEASETISAENEANDEPPRGSPERGPGDVPRTTTTGDPDKDFRSAGDGAVEDLSEGPS